ITLRKLRIALEDDLAFQTRVRIRTTQAKVSRVTCSHAEESVDVIAQAKIHREVLRNAEVVLHISAPVTEALVRSPHDAHRRIAAITCDSAEHELRQAVSSQPRIRIGGQTTAKVKTGGEATLIDRVLQPVNKTRLDGMLSQDFGHVIQKRISLGAGI